MGFAAIAMGGTSRGSGSSSGKKVKPEEVSLYDQRLISPASGNAATVSRLMPWDTAAQETAATALTQAGRVSPLYGQLEQQAGDELALGGQLSADEVRQATQGARAAYQARGLGMSAPSAFAEVLGRITLSNQRKGERRQFAMGVAELGDRQRTGFSNLLSSLAQQRMAAEGIAEGQRQFDVERDDTIRFNDKRIAADIKIGKENAAAGKSAGRTSAFGSIIGGIAKLF